MTRADRASNYSLLVLIPASWILLVFGYLIQSVAVGLVISYSYALLFIIPALALMGWLYGWHTFQEITDEG